MRTLFLAALAVLALAWVGSGTARAAFPGENGRIAFGGGTIDVIEPDGSGRTFLTCGGQRGPAWSPDGKRIAFTTTTREDPLELDVETMRADGTGRARIVQGAIRPAWSPDGQELAFTTPADPRMIGIVNADGTDVRILDQGDAPAWSPDGDRIAFERGGGLWTMRPDGSDLTRLADGIDPAWSPDGRRIAFIRFGRMWTMNADGTDETELDAHGFNPAWSPDGRRIAFDRLLLKGTWIHAINAADGSDPVVLTRGVEPDWQPRPDVDLPPRQFCFGKLRRNTRRGIARLAVRVPAAGRVVLERRRGVKRFAQAHRGDGPGRIVLRVRPRGRAESKLARAGRTQHRVQLPVRAQVTFRPRVGEALTKGRRVWLVRTAPR